MLAKTGNVGHPDVFNKMEGFANQNLHYGPPIIPPDVLHNSLTGGSPSDVLILVKLSHRISLPPPPP